MTDLLGALLGRFAAVLETKVSAAGLGVLIGAALSWALDTYVFRQGSPGWAKQAIEWVAPILGALLFGYIAPHTHRPELAAPTAAAVPEAPRPPAS
jgi:hypothetical protein